jgi:hypothetical protein
VWWTWTAPANLTVDLEAIGGPFHTLLSVYTGGSISNLGLVASDAQDEQSDRSRVTFAAVAGTAYQIAVDGVSETRGTLC